MTEIKFDAIECESLTQSVQERIDGWEVIQDSIEEDGCDGYGSLIGLIVKIGGVEDSMKYNQRKKRT